MPVSIFLDESIKMNTSTKYITAGIIYLLIPVIQRCLSAAGSLNQQLKDYIDNLAFSMAKRLDVNTLNRKNRWY